MTEPAGPSDQTPSVRSGSYGAACGGPATGCEQDGELLPDGTGGQWIDHGQACPASWRPCRHCDGCTLSDGTHGAAECDCGCPEADESATARDRPNGGD